MTKFVLVFCRVDRQLPSSTVIMAVYIEVSRKAPVSNASFGRAGSCLPGGSCLNKL